MNTQYMTPHGVPLPALPVRRTRQESASIWDTLIKNLLISALYIVFLIALFIFL